MVFLFDSVTNVLDREDGLSLSTKIDDKNAEREAFFSTFQRSLIGNKIPIRVTNKSKEVVLNKILKGLEEI